MILADIDTRSKLVEDCVAADDLDEATKLLMDFVSDFSGNRLRKREVIAIRRTYNALRSDLRTEGKTQANLRRLTALTHQILDFVDVVREEFSGALLAAPTIWPKPLLSSGNHDLPQVGPIAFVGSRLRKTLRSGPRRFTLHAIDLTLRAGQITALVGENGSGKTTLLNIVSGQLKAEGGVEYPLLAQDDGDLYAIRSRIGVMPQRLSVWKGRMADNLHFTAAIRGIQGSRNAEEVEFVLHRLGLEGYRNATWKELSGGFRTRFELARILIADPLLLVLDEPLANLDITTQLHFLSDFRQLVRSASRPMAAIISSQHVHEIEAVADQIIFLKDGKVIYNGSMETFGEERSENCYEIACNVTYRQLQELLKPVPGIRVTPVGLNFLIETRREFSAKSFLEILLKNSLSISYFRDISTSTRKLFEDAS